MREQNSKVLMRLLFITFDEVMIVRLLDDIHIGSIKNKVELKF